MLAITGLSYSKRGWVTKILPITGKHRCNFSSVYRGLSSLCLAKGIKILLKGDQCHFHASVKETEEPGDEVTDPRPPEDQLQNEH